MRKAAGRAMITVGGVGLGLFLYYQWLNVPPSVHIPTPVLPSPNGYDALNAAAKLQIDTDKVSDAIARIHVKGHPVYTQAQKDAIVASNSAALAAVRQALILPYWNPPARSADSMFPALGKVRGHAHLLALESEVRAAHGDYAGAVSSSIDADAVGLKVAHGGVLIVGLVGIACEAIGDRPLWALVDKLDASSAKSAANRLETLTNDRFPFSRTIQEEKWDGQAMMRDDLTKHSTFGLIKEYTVSAAGEGDDPDVETKPSTSQVLGIWKAFLTHSKRRILADYTATMDKVSAQADTPFNAPHAAIPIPDDPINYALFPIITKSRFKDIQVRMETNLLICALALRSYKTSHNDYPAALSDLITSGILQKLPDDPFAKAFGTAFGYRRISADKYLLYSVGPDGIDNGGKPVDASKTANPGRAYPLDGDIGDWVVGVNEGRPEATSAPH